jgi:DNA-binding NarL/FixJ family response regulator
MLNGNVTVHGLVEESQSDPEAQQVQFSRMSARRPLSRRRPEDLTPREREILELVWSGLTNQSRTAAIPSCD